MFLAIMPNKVVFICAGLAHQSELYADRRSVCEPSLLFMAQVLAHQMGLAGEVRIGESPEGRRRVDAYQQTIDRECYFTLEPILLRRGT